MEAETACGIRGRPGSLKGSGQLKERPGPILSATICRKRRAGGCNVALDAGKRNMKRASRARRVVKDGSRTARNQPRAEAREWKWLEEPKRPI